MSPTRKNDTENHTESRIEVLKFNSGKTVKSGIDDFLFFLMKNKGV